MILIVELVTQINQIQQERIIQLISYEQIFQQQSMDKVEKKKRQVSGSRSKSRKSKPNEPSLDLKPVKQGQPPCSYDHSKNKTENSLNKSKGKKCSKYTKKNKLAKGNKQLGEDSKDISRSISAERKHSLTKMNRTQANLQGENIEKRIYQFKRIVKKIEKPNKINSKEIFGFYRQIQDSIETISEPLYSLLCYLHQLYMQPVTKILQLIEPCEILLQRKEQLHKEVEDQIMQNQKIYNRLSQEDLQIIKLKKIIEEQRQLIEQKKDQQKYKIEDKNKQSQYCNINQTELFKNNGFLRGLQKDKNSLQIATNLTEKSKNNQNQLKTSLNFKDKNWKKEEAERDSSTIQISNIDDKRKETTIAMKGIALKLDLGCMNRDQAVGFHDQFYSNIDEFSQSWRNQALREKRF